MAKWTKSGDYIKVSVQGKSDFGKEWIGIGFSKNPYMVIVNIKLGSKYHTSPDFKLPKDVLLSNIQGQTEQPKLTIRPNN